MKAKKENAKYKTLNREEMLKICGGTNAGPLVVVIDGKTVYIWP